MSGSEPSLNATLGLAHQQQLLVFIQGKIVEAIPDLPARPLCSEALDPRPEPIGRFFSSTMCRGRIGRLLLQRLGIAQVAGIDDILLRIARQLVRKATTALQRKWLGACVHLDAIAEQGTINRGERRPRTSKPTLTLRIDAVVGNNRHIKPPASNSRVRSRSANTPATSHFSSRPHSHEARGMG